jgi:putative ABC transport system permease protein
MKPFWLLVPLNEWRRRPARTAVTVSGVALAVAAAFSLVGFERGYRRSLARELDRLGAHILVVPKGCPYDATSLALHGANWPCYLPAGYLAEIRAVAGVKAAVPALMTAWRTGQDPLVVYLGTDPSLPDLRPYWRIQGRFPTRQGELLAGSQIAHREGWRTGGTVRLPGLVGAQALLCGILEPTGAAEDHFLYLPLADAQALFNHPNQLTHVLVRLDDPAHLEQVVAQLRGCNAGMNLNVVPLTHLFRTIQHLLRSTRSLLASVVVVAALIAATGVTNALLMSVNERTQELGIFRALGASRFDIFRLILGESAVICSGGAVLGLGASLAGARVLETWLRVRLPFVPAGNLMDPDTFLFLACLVGAVGLGALAGCLPAWRACILPPHQAMRNPAQRA